MPLVATAFKSKMIDWSFFPFFYISSALAASCYVLLYPVISMIYSVMVVVVVVVVLLMVMVMTLLVVVTAYGAGISLFSNLVIC